MKHSNDYWEQEAYWELERLRDELYAQDLITMEGLKRLNTLIGEYTTAHDERRS